MKRIGMFVGSALCLTMGCGFFGPRSQGTLHLYARATQAGYFSAKKAATPTTVTLSSVTLIIGKIELEGSGDDNLDFESEVPYIINLNVNDSEQVLDSLSIPKGTTYTKVKFEIEKLDGERGSLFVNNPELQGKSILIKGYLSNDTARSFVFSTDLEQELERELVPPLDLSSGGKARLTFFVSTNTWFADTNGAFLDPTDPLNKPKIENAIKASIGAAGEQLQEGDQEQED